MTKIKLHDHLPYLLGQIYQRRQRHLEKVLQQMGIKESEYRILLALGDNNGCSVTQLADLTVIDRTTLSRILNSMESKGLVIRTQSNTDMRSFNVYKTPSGNQMFERAVPTAQRQLSRLTQGLPQQDIRDITRILQSIVSNLDREDGQAADKPEKPSKARG